MRRGAECGGQSAWNFLVILLFRFTGAVVIVVALTLDSTLVLSALHIALEACRREGNIRRQLATVVSGHNPLDHIGGHLTIPQSRKKQRLVAPRVVKRSGAAYDSGKLVVLHGAERCGTGICVLLLLRRLLLLLLRSDYACWCGRHGRCATQHVAASVTDSPVHHVVVSDVFMYVYVCTIGFGYSVVRCFVVPCLELAYMHGVQ